MTKTEKAATGANFGFEAKLWLTADKLLAGQGDYAGANPEDPDEYKAENVFWVPADARWAHLQASAKQTSIGKTVDDAMVAIERESLPKLRAHFLGN